MSNEKNLDSELKKQKDKLSFEKEITPVVNGYIQEGVVSVEDVKNVINNICSAWKNHYIKKSPCERIIFDELKDIFKENSLIDILNLYLPCYIISKPCKRITTSSGWGGSRKVSFWRPKVDATLNEVYFWDICCSGCNFDGDTTIVSYDKKNLMKPPSDFVKYWEKPARDGNAMFVWKPIPPEGYAAVGQVITINDEDPRYVHRQLRCLPKKCLVKLETGKQIWNDAGTGGSDGAFFEVPINFSQNILNLAPAFICAAVGMQDCPRNRGRYPRISPDECWSIRKELFDIPIPNIKKITTSKGWGASRPVSFWRPIVKTELNEVYFWDTCSAGHRAPPCKALVVSDNSSKMAIPIDFKQYWEQPARSGDKMIVWKAIPPNEDYIAVGYVITINSQRPKDIHRQLRCLHKSYLNECKSGKQIWNDSGTGGKDGAFYEILLHIKRDDFQYAPAFVCASEGQSDCPRGRGRYPRISPDKCWTVSPKLFDARIPKFLSTTTTITTKNKKNKNNN